MIVAAVMLLSLCGSLSAEAAKIPVIKNGMKTSLKGTRINVRYGDKAEPLSVAGTDTPSVKIGSTIYVPCKTIFSDNGIKAEYARKGNQVSFRHGARKVVFYGNKDYARVNGTKMKLKVKPYFVTFTRSNVADLLVPAQQAASFFGLKYEYNKKAKMVTLKVRPGIHQSAVRDKDIEKSKFIKKAQAILESGWGQSSLAKNGNNLFGMKVNLSGNNWAGSAWDGVNAYKKGTYEYGSGGRYRITAKFRKYSCIEDSIEDHSAYLLNAKNGSRKRYAGLTATTSYKKQLQIIRKGGYATSGSYVSQLCRVIQTYNLTKWDK